MNIRRVTGNEVPFEQIQIGETFIYGLNYYMRMETEEGQVRNAVNLGSGGITLFFDDEQVEPIECYLAVE